MTPSPGWSSLRFRGSRDRGDQRLARAQRHDHVGVDDQHPRCTPPHGPVARGDGVASSRLRLDDRLEPALARDRPGCVAAAVVDYDDRVPRRPEGGQGLETGRKPILLVACRDDDGEPHARSGSLKNVAAASRSRTIG